MHFFFGNVKVDCYMLQCNHPPLNKSIFCNLICIDAPSCTLSNDVISLFPAKLPIFGIKRKSCPVYVILTSFYGIFQTIMKGHIRVCTLVVSQLLSETKGSQFKVQLLAMFRGEFFAVIAKFNV